MSIDVMPSPGLFFHNEANLSGLVEEVLHETREVRIRWTCHCIECGPKDRFSTWPIEEWKQRCTLVEDRP